MSDDIRQLIVSSALSKRNPDGAGPEEYAGHLKIYEQDEGGSKSRFIILSYNRGGQGFIHKSKQNPSGSFSIGKTWRLDDLQGLEVVDQTSFRISFNRSYVWTGESSRDQSTFLTATVQLYRQLKGSTASLTLVGVQEAPNRSLSRGPAQIRSREEQYGSPGRSGSPSGSRDGGLYGGLAPTPSISRSARTDYGRTTPVGNTTDYESRSPAMRPRAELGGRSARTDAGGRDRAASRSRPPVDRQPSNEYSRPSLDREREREPDFPRGERERERGGRQQAPERQARPVPAEDLRQPIQASYNQPTPVDDRGWEPVQDRPRNGVQSRPAPQATTVPPASTPSRSHLRPQNPPALPDQASPSPKRDPNARISFFDPANQAAADRLLFGASEGIGAIGEEDPAEATMANVEEMLEGIEWGFAGGYAGAAKKGRTGAADMIEARLLDELMALEKANIHSFLESDDRVAIVLNYIDDAIKELDEMDGYISAYKVQLNSVSEDISFIQSQDRGLQVQTQNQKALLNELENLLRTVDVDTNALSALTQSSLESLQGIKRLEGAVTELYKALVASRETGMAAGMERLDQYLTHNTQFCKRLLDFLNIAFKFKVSTAAFSGQGEQQQPRSGPPTLPPHSDLETYLGRYCGLMLYLKEMDEDRYAKVCANYFSTASDMHSREMKVVFMAFMNMVKSAPADEGELTSFTPPVTISTASRAGGTLKRAKTLARTIADRKERNNKPAVAGELNASDALLQLLDLLAPQISREQVFLADFLLISDATLTFADYMGLENYLRRKASAAAGELKPSTVKLIRGAMDLIFGFLGDELKHWLDGALERDPQQIVGIIAAIEQAQMQAEDKGIVFTQRLLSKQHQRAVGIFTRYIDNQIKAIEQTKLSTKKRGVAHFIKYFPIFVERIEPQVSGLDSLEVRGTVDAGYDKIIKAMFECLQQMAKMDGADGQLAEDKGMLNYHVIMIENMQYFVSEMTDLDSPAVSPFSRQAKTIYEEHLNSYVKLVLRKPLAKIIDFFDGVERMLQTAAPSEVLSSSAYGRSALKRVLKDFDSKDIRKSIEALFKRIEKHFDEDGEMVVSSTSKVVAGTVMAAVWQACDEEIVRETQRFSRIISQCYGDSGLSLDYSIADVEYAFKRHRA
ncbi:hypothetical protein M407DRAFT_234528 [Tulasnella calospora MUT 4182]|uniref:Exocyst complex component Sec3 PIP2-binding N-terminal domain-containing protein n=1 Tax=Tulasnella calospora MUT 4182 TaxID=1051891 RepID=A0A0C3MI65_9AGAM|nr:hypothetical protein M407DRAFT_234528 [Tulasnella calospora MUT 4182]